MGKRRWQLDSSRLDLAGRLHVELTRLPATRLTVPWWLWMVPLVFLTAGLMVGVPWWLHGHGLADRPIFLQTWFPATIFTATMTWFAFGIRRLRRARGQTRVSLVFDRDTLESDGNLAMIRGLRAFNRADYTLHLIDDTGHAVPVGVPIGVPVGVGVIGPESDKRLAGELRKFYELPIEPAEPRRTMPMATRLDLPTKDSPRGLWIVPVLLAVLPIVLTAATFLDQRWWSNTPEEVMQCRYVYGSVSALLLSLALLIRWTPWLRQVRITAGDDSTFRIPLHGGIFRVKTRDITDIAVLHNGNRSQPHIALWHRDERHPGDIVGTTFVPIGQNFEAMQATAADLRRRVGLLDTELDPESTP